MADAFSFFDNLASSSASIVSSQGALSTGQDSVSQVIQQSSQMVVSARAQVSLISAALVSSLARVPGIITGLMARAVSAVTGIVTQGVSLLVSGLGSILGIITETVTQAAGAVRGNSGGFVSLISGTVSTLFSNIGQVVSMIGQSIVNAGAAIVGAIISPIRTAIQSAFSSLISSTMSAVSGAISSASSILAPIAIAIVGILGNFAVAGLSRLFSMAASALGAVGRFVTAATPVVISAVTSLWGVLRVGIVQVAGIAQTAFTTLASWASSVWTWVSTLVSRAAGFISSNAGGIIAGLSSAFSYAVQFGAALGRFLPAASILGVFTTAVAGAAQAALKLADAARALSASTGFGLSRSAGLLGSLGAQGVGSGAVQGLFQSQSPLALNMKLGAFGLPSVGSGNFAEALSGRFQSMNNSGPIGNIMAQAMRRVLGVQGGEWNQLLTASPRTIRGNAAFASNINASLGLTPQQLAGYAETVPALLTRIGTAVTSIVTKLAGEALPFVEQGLSTAARIIGDNAPQIGQAIGSLVEWVSTKVLPTFLSSGGQLLAMAGKALVGFINFANWFVANIEEILAGAGQTIGDILRSWAVGFSEWSNTTVNSFADFLSNMGTVIGQGITNIGNYVGGALQSFGQWLYTSWATPNSPLRQVAIGIGTTLDSIVNGFATFTASMAQGGAILNNLILANPAMAAVIAASTHQLPHFISPSGAAAAATAGIGVSNTAGMIQRALAGPALPQLGGAFANAGMTFQSNSTALGTNFTSAMGDLSNSVRQNGLTASGAIARGLYGLGGLASSPDGSYNAGRTVGRFGADTARPYVELLNGIESITGSMGGNGGVGRQQQESQGTLKEIRDLLRQQLQVNRDGFKTIGQSMNPDVVAGTILSEYSAARSSALKRLP